VTGPQTRSTDGTVAATAETVGEPRVIVLPDPDSVSRRAAELVAAVLVDAIATRGRADWATTGGSTPIGIYRALADAPLRDSIAWDSVHLWFGDDRYVPRDHPLSNVFPADEVLLAESARAGLSGRGAAAIDVEVGAEEGVPLPPANVHPFPCTEAIAENRGAAWAAASYAEEVRSAVRQSADGWPAFDLVLLGIGPDGHLLSVFPGSAALSSTDLAMAIPAPTHIEPHVERVTLNPAMLGVARNVLAVVLGAGKADVLGRIFGSDRDPSALPAQLARRTGATWVIDSAAAAKLPGEVRTERAG
jgi:6-phosphogluconolactonase